MVLFASRLARGLPFSQHLDVHAHPYHYQEAINSGSSTDQFRGSLDKLTKNVTEGGQIAEGRHC